MKQILFLSILLFSFSCVEKQETMQQLIDRSMQVAVQQSKNMAAALAGSGELPRSTDSETGELLTSGSDWWCSGFYPGTLWYLYEYTNDPELKTLAEAYTALIEKEKTNIGTHDLGFMLYCPFGNGLRLANNQEYVDVLLTGSKSLCSRYNPTVGLIRSWDHGTWKFPVIIDNMMNLEMLMWAFKQSGDSMFLKISESHADITMANHFRSDNSCYHVVDYDTITGGVIAKQTCQGAFDESIWARGQAWGLYGYTMMFRETGNEAYLEQAKKIAALMIDHPNMPADQVPYWDYLAVDIPNEKRDASTASVMASALIELSGYVDGDLKAKYLQVAEIQLRTLASPEYMAEVGTNGGFILKHSVGAIPLDSEVDVPLTYADYYFVEALLRYKKLL